MSEQLNHPGPSYEDMQDAIKAAKDVIDQTGTGDKLHYKNEIDGREIIGSSVKGENVHYGGDSPGVSAEVRNYSNGLDGNGSRNTHYEAYIEPPKGLEHSTGKTRIERRDAQGNSVYVHESDNPTLARQVAVVAANGVKRTAEKKAALAAGNSELPKAA